MILGPKTGHVTLQGSARRGSAVPKAIWGDGSRSLAKFQRTRAEDFEGTKKGGARGWPQKLYSGDYKRTLPDSMKPW